MRNISLIIRKFATDMSYRVVARGAAAVMQATSLVFIARDLGVLRFGSLSVGLSMATVSGTALGMGNSVRALRMAREHAAAKTTTAMFIARAVSSTASGLLGAAVAFLLGLQLAGAIALALIVVCDQQCELEQAVLSGQQRQVAAANWILWQRLIPFMLVFTANGLHVSTVAAYGVASGVVLSTIVIGPVRRWQRPISPKELFVGSRGYWAASLSGSLIGLDTFVVRSFAGSVIAGLYSAASRATAPVFILIGTFLTVITPTAALAPSAGQRARILKLATGGAVLIAVPLIVVSPYVADLFVHVLGAEYSQARGLVTAFIIAAAISGISQAYQARLYTDGHPLVAGAAIFTGIAAGLIGLTVMARISEAKVLWLGPIVTQLIVLLCLHLGQRYVRASNLPRALPVASQDSSAV